MDNPDILPEGYELEEADYDRYIFRLRKVVKGRTCFAVVDFNEGTKRTKYISITSDLDDTQMKVQKRSSDLYLQRIDEYDNELPYGS